MKTIHFLIIMALLLVIPLSGDLQASTCHEQQIHELTRPFYPRQTNSPTFQYRFWYKPARLNQPTVIFIPGGPGNTSMTGSMLSDDLPPEFGQMLTDPRGVGCNDVAPSVPGDDFFSTINIALDIAAAIKELRLRHYILHGQSFGSMVAVMVAFIVEHEGDLKPDALVLEGTIGRHFEGKEGYIDYLRRWSRIRQILPSPALQELSQHNPLGISSRIWGRALSVALSFGIDPRNQTPIEEILSAAAPGSDPEKQNNLKQLVNFVGTLDAGSAAERLYHIVTCHEIYPKFFLSTTDVEFDLERGQMIFINPGMCQDIPLDKPFDVRQWNTNTPIYYFAGDEDPSTPLWQTLYHIQSQGRSSRTLVLVKNGGHCALDSALNDLSNCNSSIWKAIGSGGDGLESALSGCAYKTEVTRIPATTGY